MGVPTQDPLAKGLKPEIRRGVRKVSWVQITHDLAHSMKLTTVDSSEKYFPIYELRSLLSL